MNAIQRPSPLLTSPRHVPKLALYPRVVRSEATSFYRWASLELRDFRTATPPKALKSLAMSHPALLIPAGNWAEWVGSVLAGGSLIGIVVGMRGERKARREDLGKSILEHRRAQAQLVSAWLQDPPEGNPKIWELRVVNRSDLSIRSARGFVYQVRPQWRPLGAFLAIPVVPPGLPEPASERIEIEADVKAVALVLVFTDEAGVRWRKYHPGDPEGLAEVAPGDRVLDDWLGFASDG